MSDNVYCVQCCTWAQAKPKTRNCWIVSLFSLPRQNCTEIRLCIKLNEEGNLACSTVNVVPNFGRNCTLWPLKRDSSFCLVVTAPFSTPVRRGANSLAWTRVSFQENSWILGISIPFPSGKKGLVCFKICISFLMISQATEIKCLLLAFVAL